MPTYNVSRLQQFFLEAALATYASGKKAEPHSALSGVKWYRRMRDEFIYEDVFRANGEHSGGETVIYVHGKAAWLMQYHGWCKNDDHIVLGVLKKALHAAYERGDFLGGRGVLARDEVLANKVLCYRNEPWGSFQHFGGHERIFKNLGQDVFWHRYQGLLLGEAE